MAGWLSPKRWPARVTLPFLEQRLERQQQVEVGSAERHAASLHAPRRHRYDRRTMTDGGLRDVDANLLLPLHALLEERNLTHAGTRMAMSQPAMSGALARLRKHFGDELLVRAGRGFELTPLAEQLRPFVADAVEAAEGLLGHPRGFDPRTSRKQFEVSMSEYAMTVLSEPLNRLLCEQAPACSVAFDSVPPSWDRFESQLIRRDLIVVPLGFDFPGDQAADLQR